MKKNGIYTGYFFNFCILVMMLCCVSFSVFADIQFPDWISTQSEQYVKELINENNHLSTEEIKLIKQRMQHSVEEKNGVAIAIDAARLAGNAPTVRERWVDLSFALMQKAKVPTDDWKTQQNLKLAAFKVYQMSTTKEEKAEGLLLFGNQVDSEAGYEQPSYLEILQEINTLVNINEFRKKHPRFSNLMPFMFLKTRLNTDNLPPNVCFLFSHPLAKKDIHYEDYASLMPKVEGAFKVNGRELCFSPLKFGDTYDLTFKSGLPSELNEKIPQSQSISFVVKDQSARLSFATKAYVLMQNEEALVPLSGVNVERVHLKILRINDRDLNQVIAGNMKFFLEPLWPYSEKQIKDTLGELVWEGNMDFSALKNQTVTKQIPFSSVVKSIQPGVYIIQAQQGTLENSAQATQWLVVSDIGISALNDRQGAMMVQTRSLKNAEPLSNVEVQLIAYNNSILAKQKTTSDGIVRFEPALTSGKGGNRPMMLLVYGPKGDFSLLDIRSPALDLSDRGVSGLKPLGPLNAFLYTEQGVYRANDTVHINALLRDEQEAKGNLPLSFKFLRPDGIEVEQKTLMGDAIGHYALEWPISSSARTGQWSVLAYSDLKKDPIGSVQFTVEDFVPSRLTVSLKSAEAVLDAKQPLLVEVSGRYLFGAKATGLEGDASLTLQVNPKPFPKFAQYAFGLIDEQWTDERIPLPFAPLDAEGKETLKVALDHKPKTSKPLEAILEVTLRDNGGRPETGHLSLPLRFSEYNIGLKAAIEDKRISEEQTEVGIDVITLNSAGNLNAVENLEYELYFEDQNYAWYQSEDQQAWQYKVLTDSKFITKGTLSTVATGPVNIKIPVIQEGAYRIEVRDPKTQIASSIRLYKGWAVASQGASVPDFLNLGLNKAVYKEGDNLELKITAPFDGKALLTIANQQVLETQNINVSKSGTVVKLKVNSEWGTGAYCMVSAFRPLEKTQENQGYLPKRAIGVAYMNVDTADKKLNIQFQLPNEALPQQSIEIPISVSSTDKKQLSSVKMTVSAVDEGILKLTDFKLPDPAHYFFGQHQLSIDIRDLYGKLIDPIPGALGALRTGGDLSMFARNLQALSKRSFKVVSLYAGELALDQEGKATLRIQLPDFNGQLRLMGVAFDAKRLGSAEASLLVRDPVVLEAVLPRFLAPSDESQLALSLDNVKGPAGEYTVDFKAEGNIRLKNPAPLKIHLAPEGHFESRVPIQALGHGEGRIVVQLSGPDIKVRRTYDLSIREATPFSTQITSTQLKPKESVKLSNPELDIYQAGTEAIELSWSTQVPWDSVMIAKKLLSYAYGCVEQTVSKGVATLFSAQDLTPILARLSEAQQAEGGFSLWPGNQRDIWLTAYVADFLQRVEAKELKIPKFTLERALNFLAKNIVNNGSQNVNDAAATAYALYVLAKTDKIETGNIRYFYDLNYAQLDNVSLARIGSAFLSRQDDARANKAFSLMYTNMKTTEKELNPSPFGSALRDKAICILLLREAKMSENLLYSLTQTLGQDIAKQKELSTNEAAFVLLASSAFGQNAGTPQISINGVINKAPESGQAFSVQEFRKGVSIQNQGKGNVWQHMAFSGIPKVPPMAASAGFNISRSYYTMEGVPYTENTVPQGTQLVVVLEGFSVEPSLAHQVLVVDLLPAGLEIESSLTHSGNGQSSFAWLRGLSTPEYAEPRDDRFVSSMRLDQKTPQFKLAYQVRAVTPGTYKHPGLFVEDMYATQYYAQTAESTFSVKAP